ncbi:MAG: hypothetical protein AAGA78_07215 [Pseudomonadota bacterium]
MHSFLPARAAGADDRRHIRKDVPELSPWDGFQRRALRAAAH